MNQEENKRTWLYYSVLIALLIFFTWGFAEVVDALKENEVQNFDHLIIKEVQSWINEGRTSRMVFITNLASVRFLAAGTIIITAFLLFKKRWHYAMFFLLTVSLGAGLFNKWLKAMFQRQRPEILPLIEQGGYSFPSGHSMGSFIFYGAIAFLLYELLDKGWSRLIGAAFAVALIFLIGLTRIYLGVHYPSDVIGGYTAGAAWLTFSMAAFHYFEYRVNKRRRRKLQL
ncbi:undecaprenyl-diphosphatase [Bacillus ectoiniformans]|uniref:phosphatase PAP2 family protein n=1 Tax=Bacillus ectoiniformans TaxID=1494429 RepID=UPI001EF965F3|nr:phosphatase PAP2 family protein [Bacillus ectoiniformans]MBM7647809.1 undecaprenyl-diphosphatase [Bacillus ectoiniformans]